MPAPSYVSGPSAKPMLGETIGENLRRTAERFPDRDALVVPYQGYRATYREFWQQTGRVARALLVRGVKKGDRVGIWAPNRFEWVVVQYATARIGAILVTINPAYRTHELEYALKQSGVSTLVLARGFRGADYVQMVWEVKSKCPDLRQTVVIEEEWHELDADALRLSEEELHHKEVELQFDEPINIQYTSGTTGFPKGATLSHHNVLNNGYFIGEILKYTEADRVCIPVPLYHCFGQVIGNFACTTHGAAMVYPGEGFEPLAVMKTVQDERCTSLYGVPTMFIAELDHPEFASFDYSTLRTGVMAGSPCPVEVMKKVQKDMHMPEVTICYGMTETAPVSTQSRTDDPLEKRVSTVGPVHPHVEVKVIDPTTGRVVPRGMTGELCTRGYSVMLGYWNDPHATRNAIDDGRWMHTGDLGHDGRRRVRQHRRAHQGHGAARRGEHLPARGGGVPLHRPRSLGRPGDRRPGREVRRGAHGLGEAPPGGRAHGGGDPRVLSRQGRDLQDPSVLQVRRLLPHDRLGEDPEVQDARDRHPGAWAPAGGRDQDGLTPHPTGSRTAGAGEARRRPAVRRCGEVA